MGSVRCCPWLREVRPEIASCVWRQDRGDLDERALVWEEGPKPDWSGIWKGVEATQVSTDRGTDEKNVIHPHDGTIFSLKKEGNSDTCYNTDAPQTLRSVEGKKPITRRHSV